MHKSYKNYWIVGIIAVIAVVVFLYQDSIKEWFFVEKVTKESQKEKDKSEQKNSHVKGENLKTSEGDVAEKKDAPVLKKEFSKEKLEQLKELFEAISGIQDVLADDRMDYQQGTEKIDSETKKLIDEENDLVLKQAYESIQGDAKKMQFAGNIAEARNAFSSMSEKVFWLATVDKRLQEGWNVFRCPMVKTFPKWLQKGEKLKNPYMGKKMLMCGSSTTWGEAEHKGAVQNNSHQEEEKGEIAYYTCPMHPSVHLDKMGQCPICHMDLTPVTYASLKSGKVMVDHSRRERIGVKIETLKKMEVERTIPLLGEIQWDESRVYDIAPRVKGWVERMYVDKVGEEVKKYQTLATFYSPDILASERELLSSPPGSRLAAMAEERLQRLGMSSNAIRQVMKTKKPIDNVRISSPASGFVLSKTINDGTFFNAGKSLYQIVDPSRVWVIADVYEQDVQYVKVGGLVTVSSPMLNEEAKEDALGSVKGKQLKIDYVYPEMDVRARTVKVRVVLENPKHVLRPGMLMTMKLHLNLGQKLVVPEDAVVFAGDRKIVFIDVGEDRLQPVEVVIGMSTDQGYIIEKGLKEGDKVVTSGVFLVAAESRIRSSSGFWSQSGEEGKKGELGSDSVSGNERKEGGHHHGK